MRSCGTWTQSERKEPKGSKQRSTPAESQAPKGSRDSPPHSVTVGGPYAVGHADAADARLLLRVGWVGGRNHHAASYDAVHHRSDGESTATCCSIQAEVNATTASIDAEEGQDRQQLHQWHRLCQPGERAGHDGARSRTDASHYYWLRLASYSRSSPGLVEQLTLEAGTRRAEDWRLRGTKRRIKAAHVAWCQ